MGRRRSLAVVVAAVLVPAAVGVVLLEHDREGPQSTAGAARGEAPEVVPGTAVFVQSGVPSTRFLPLGQQPDDGHTLSAQRAYNALVSDSAKLNPIPATVRPYYGVLRDASAAPVAVNVRVWGFAVESGCHDTGEAPASSVPSPSSPTHCRLWEFVDARTGRNLGVISQEVLPD
ncbi:MAG TPA: hypothetical protein VH228_13110 [Nocardioides sp.]|jgi:hypothetical protein|nr:hypothetical protein [Nocardioides sp.]